MKHLKKIPFFCLLVISCLILTVCGFLGKKNAYQNYTDGLSLAKMPLLSLVFEGIYHDVMPWECLNDPSVPDYMMLAKQDESTDTGLAGSAVSDSSNPQTADAANSGTPDSSAHFESESAPSETPDMTATSAPPGPDGLPLVSYTRVNNDYFDDAVFIGDSRTRSLQLYSGLENTTFLADTGLTIYTVLDKKITPSTQTSKTTVTDYLTDHQFAKIYLMLGINELGTGNAQSFTESYREVLKVIRELQPDAVIYLQAILHVSEEKDNEHTYINNASIIERNESLKTLADNTHIFWLDANPVLCDENDYLIANYTFDGVHLKAKYVPAWVEWIKSHAVDTFHAADSQ